MRAQPLFNGDVVAVTGGPSWTIWRPSDPPWPAPTGSALQCVDGELRPRQLARVGSQRMCLAPNDTISQRIRRRGRWYDCSLLLRAWKTMVADDAGSAVLLELGAHIGACTVAFLLETVAERLEQLSSRTAAASSSLYARTVRAARTHGSLPLSPRPPTSTSSRAASNLRRGATPGSQVAWSSSR